MGLVSRRSWLPEVIRLHDKGETRAGRGAVRPVMGRAATSQGASLRRGFAPLPPRRAPAPRTGCRPLRSVLAVHAETSPPGGRGTRAWPVLALRQGEAAKNFAEKQVGLRRR